MYLYYICIISIFSVAIVRQSHVILEGNVTEIYRKFCTQYVTDSTSHCDSDHSFGNIPTFQTS